MNDERREGDQFHCESLISMIFIFSILIRICENDEMANEQKKRFDIFTFFLKLHECASSMTFKIKMIVIFHIQK